MGKDKTAIPPQQPKMDKFTVSMSKTRAVDQSPHLKLQVRTDLMKFWQPSRRPALHSRAR